MSRIPPELEDLAEIARRESLDQFLYNISVIRTRPYSRISAICTEDPITLAEVCRKGPTEPPYSEIRTLYNYAKKWCGKERIIIYRGGSEIKPGDWVALEKEYAESHGVPVYSTVASPEDIIWAGTYVKEWYYVPKHLQGLFRSSKEFWEVANSYRGDRMKKVVFSYKEDVVLRDLEFFGRHARHVEIDGDRGVVILTDPDDELLEELENRGIKYKIVRS